MGGGARGLLACGALTASSACTALVDWGSIHDDAKAPAAPTADGAPPADSGGPGSGDGAPTASRYAAAVLADHPLVYLRFGERAPETRALSASGVEGAYSGGGVTLGAPGALADDADTAVTFTDGLGRITVPLIGPFDGTRPFSVEVWAKPSAANTNNGFIVDEGEWTTARYGWTLRAGTTGATFERWASASAHNSIGTSPLAPEQWHHIVGTFDGAIQRLYVDNVRVDAGPTTLSLPAQVSPLAVGHQNCCPVSTGNSFIGSVDELAFYEAPLTEAQIAAHFAAAR